jgi:hypothetical protein
VRNCKANYHLPRRNSRAWRGKNSVSPTEKAYITTQKTRGRGAVVHTAWGEEGGATGAPPNPFVPAREEEGGARRVPVSPSAPAREELDNSTRPHWRSSIQYGGGRARIGGGVGHRVADAATARTGLYSSAVLEATPPQLLHQPGEGGRHGRKSLGLLDPRGGRGCTCRS